MNKSCRLRCVPVIAFLLMLCCSGSAAFARNSSEPTEDDEITDLVHSLPNLEGISKIEGLIKIGNYYHYRQPSVAAGFFREASALSTEHKNEKYIVLSESSLAWIYGDIGKPEEALISAQKSISIAQKIGDSDLVYTARNAEATVYSDLGRYDLAIQKHKENVELALKENNENHLATSYHNLGVTSWRLKNWSESEAFHEKSYAIRSKLGILGPANYNSLGIVKMEKGNFEDAEDLFLEAVRMAKAAKLNKNLALLYSNLGDLEQRRKNPAQSIDYLNQSISIADKINYAWVKTRSLKHLALALRDKGEPQAGLEKAVEALSLSKMHQHKGEELEILETLQSIYSSLKDFPKALETLNAYLHLKDEMLSEKVKNNALVHRAAIETAEKEKQIIDLTLARKNAEAIALAEKEAMSRLQRNVSIAGLLVMVIIIALLYNRYIQQKKSKEEIEKRNLALLHANHAKNRFLSVVGHEFHTPINEIVGLANIELKKSPDSETQTALETVVQSAYRLSENITDLLDIIKIESEEFELQSVPLNLDKLLEDSVHLNRSRAIEKGLNLKHESLTQLPNNLVGDPIRLKQILFNLVNNAVKFTDNGSVTLQSKVLGKERHHVTLEFSVIDTGIGIDPEIKKQLFENFSQADSTSNRRHGGLGLGLSISKKLLELMNSEIQVDTQPNEGSTFRFVVRLEEKSTKGEKSESDRREVQQTPYSLRVLLAEDGRVNQKIAKFETLRLGHQIEIAENGQQAVQMLSDNTFDVVLMDIDMPVMNGIEATQSIRSDGVSNDPDIFIAAFTASAMHGDRERFLAAGMNDYISKPVRPNLLNETFERALQYQLDRGINLNLRPQKEKTSLRNIPEPTPLNEIIQTYLKETPKQLSKIGEAIEKKDSVLIRQLALTISGSASYLKENELVHTCHQMELQTAENDFVRILELSKLAKTQYLESKDRVSRPTRGKVEGHTFSSSFQE